MKASLSHLRAAGLDVLDLAEQQGERRLSDYGYRLAAAIAYGEAGRGIALCGSGAASHLGQPPSAPAARGVGGLAARSPAR